MPTSRFRHLISFLLFTALSMPAWAQWQLNNEESALYYVTSKAAAISEINTFSNLAGEIGDDGRATLDIQLNSVDTSIEIRDQRMQEILFEVANYPLASVSIDTDMRMLENLSVGESRNNSVTYTLNLHGMSQTLSTELNIVKLAGDKIKISSVSPIIINAGQFALAQGVEALREVAGLPSINPNVVVTFSLVYQQAM